MHNASLLPPGFRDRLPPAAEALSRLTRTLLDTFAAHGYERVAPPLVEHEESLRQWLGGAPAPLFRSSDPESGEGLALRPDITAQVARLAATRLADAPRPLRLCYAGPVLRARAGQLSPERELTQAGAELIGSDAVPALAELVNAAVRAMRAAGIEQITLDLTTPQLVEELARRRWPVSDLKGLLAALDAKDVDALRGAERAPYRLLIEVAGEADGAIGAIAGLVPELGRNLAALADAIEGIDRLTVDPTERHGFEYQSWVGFSLFGSVGGQPLRAEVGRGGAYAVHHAAGRTARRAEPAAGLSLYLDPLVDAGLGAERRRRIFLKAGTPPEVGARLRADGWVTVMGLSAHDTAAGCDAIWDGAAAVPAGEGG